MRICVLLLTVLLIELVAARFSAIKYLVKFNYLKKENVDKPKLVAQAIRDLQYDSSLEITGKMNPETKKVMKLKRCSVRLNPNFENFVIEGSKWNHTDLTYKISKYTHDLRKGIVDRITARSFKYWSDVSSLTFEHVTDDRVPDIDILFVVGEHGDEAPFDGPQGAFAHAFFPQYGGDAHFDDDEYWVENANNYEDSLTLLQVMTHEFGHSLGLKHSTVRESVMWPFYKDYNPNFALHADDIEGIQTIYGKPIGASTTPMTTPEPYNRCRDGQVDAISIMEDGHYYAFRFGMALKLARNGNFKGEMEPISKLFPSVPDNLDGVVSWSRTRRTKARTYFFKGSEYWTKKDGVITGPRGIDCGFEGVPNNIDAVFMHRSDTIFVKGDMIYRFVRGEGSMKAVHKSKTRHWRHLPDGITAAMYHPYFRHHYFFVGKTYYRLNPFNFKVSRKYPRNYPKIWLGC